MRLIRKLWSLTSCRTASSLAKGPDRIIPTEVQYTSEPDGAVKIQRNSIELLQDYEPISIPTMFRTQAKNNPDDPALVFKRDEIDRQWTYAEYLYDVETAAKALVQIGLEPHHGVAIIGFNAPQWNISHYAAIFAGGISAGVYATSSPEICHHTASNSRANVFIVEDNDQLQKVLQIKNSLPHLKAIVQYSGKPTVEGVLSWEEFLEIGRNASDSLLTERLENMAINQAAVLLYTSGTTGLPKGAMLSHDGLLSINELARRRWTALDQPSNTFLSYLPLNHIAAMIADATLPIMSRGIVHFADKDALRGTLVKSMKQARVTIFLAVPRVLEKVYEFLLPHVPKNEELSDEKRMKLWEALGLDRCSMILTGAAPSNPDVLSFFSNTMKMAPREIYGLTEGGLATLQPDEIRLGSVGQLFIPGKIQDPNQEGEGELYLKGRTIFMGYLGEKKKTEDTFDGEWLKTGDLATKDNDGYIYISGRVKELIITSGGENIGPVIIERVIKQELPVLSNCMVIGDKRKYLTALITLRTEKDPKTEELLDDLQPDVIEWCQSIGSDSKKLSDILNGPDQKVLDEIQKGFDRANAAALSRAQRVQKWRILPTDFSLPGGEIGPTLKLKRPVVLEKYSNVIDSMYEA